MRPRSSSVRIFSSLYFVRVQLTALHPDDDAFPHTGNSRLPNFAQFNLVDIALIRADTGDTVKTFRNVTNPSNEAGFQPVTADDDFWGSDGASWDGSPTPFPFYFVAVPSGTDFSSGLPQSTFTAVRE